MTDTSGAFSAGSVIDERFRIERFLDSGGIATVYSATDVRTDEDIIIRTPNLQTSPNPNAVVHQYFEREQQILRRLRDAHTHPNVVQLVKTGTHGGTRYTAVTYIQGRELGDVVDVGDGYGDADQIRAIGISICDAVASLHEAGVLVRDLKPDNVILVGERQAKLFDFNAGTLFGDVEEPSSDPDADWGSTILSGEWKPPEVADYRRDDLNQGPWSDVYAIALLLAYLFGGSLPGRDERPADLLTDAPEYLRAVVAKATDPDPELRYRNAMALGLALRSRDPGAVPQAGLNYLPTGQVTVVWPGATVGRADGPGPSPTINVVDERDLVSETHFSLEVARTGDWVLVDHSRHGTHVRRVVGDGRDHGPWRPVSAHSTPSDPTVVAKYDPDLPTSLPTTTLSDGDEIALVTPDPDYGKRFRFRVTDEQPPGP